MTKRISHVSQYSQLGIICIPFDVFTYLSKGIPEIEPRSLIELSMTRPAPVVSIWQSHVASYRGRGSRRGSIPVDEVTCSRGRRPAALLQTIHSRSHRLIQGRPAISGSAENWWFEKSRLHLRAGFFRLQGRRSVLLGIEAETWLGGLERSRPAPRP